ncbi:MAG: tripartite tricarboxylate transporter substrate binding protein [Rubrivivax sp.]|nr:tripartite tricarboxylate transporter substrate binding protein [Rubrivivax sp.]
MVFRVIALVLALLSAQLAWGQTWPAKPVRLVVPYPPGGSVDTYARLIGQRLAERLGQPVVVDNRAGAAGSIGSEFVAKSAPDGYTLVWGTVSSHAINMTLYTKLRYDNLKDFAPITQLMEQPLMVVVPLNSKINSMAELGQVLQSRSIRLNVGTAGVGTTGHMTTELIKKRTGGDITHVGYRGSNPMLTELMGGHIDVGIDNLPSALALVKAGKLKALAVTSLKRSPLAPDIPTLDEVIPGLQAIAWQGLFAPAGTPDAVLERLEREVTSILRQPDVVAVLAQGGTTPVGSARADFAAFVKAETIRWAEIVRLAGARADD